MLQWDFIICLFQFQEYDICEGVYGLVYVFHINTVAHACACPDRLSHARLMCRFPLHDFSSAGSLHLRVCGQVRGRRNRKCGGL